VPEALHNHPGHGVRMTVDRDGDAAVRLTGRLREDDVDQVAARLARLFHDVDCVLVDISELTVEDPGPVGSVHRGPDPGRRLAVGGARTGQHEEVATTCAARVRGGPETPRQARRLVETRLYLWGYTNEPAAPAIQNRQRVDHQRRRACRHRDATRPGARRHRSALPGPRLRLNRPRSGIESTRRRPGPADRRRIGTRMGLDRTPGRKDRLGTLGTDRLSAGSLLRVLASLTRHGVRAGLSSHQTDQSGSCQRRNEPLVRAGGNRANPGPAGRRPVCSRHMERRSPFSTVANPIFVSGSIGLPDRGQQPSSLARDSTPRAERRPSTCNRRDDFSMSLSVRICHSSAVISA
jgi:hypothetical protein